MGYYMRYVTASPKELTLPLIEEGLRRADPAYRIGADGDLYCGEELYGQIEINRPGEELFDEEIEELAEELDDGKGQGKKTVAAALKDAKALVAVQVLWQGRKDTEDTLVKIDPIWEFLDANYGGLMQADGEGYYQRGKLILDLG